MRRVKRQKTSVENAPASRAERRQGPRILDGLRPAGGRQAGSGPASDVVFATAAVSFARRTGIGDILQRTPTAIRWICRTSKGRGVQPCRKALLPLLTTGLRSILNLVETRTPRERAGIGVYAAIKGGAALISRARGQVRCGTANAYSRQRGSKTRARTRRRPGINTLGPGMLFPGRERRQQKFGDLSRSGGVRWRDTARQDEVANAGAFWPPT